MPRGTGVRPGFAWIMATAVALLLMASMVAAQGRVGRVAVRPLGARSAPQAVGPGGATQEVVVSSPAYASQTATLSAYQYANGVWHLAFGPVTAELGFNGLSDNRQENDGTTPTGTYGIGSTMYGLGSSLNSRYSYHNLVCGDWWSGEHDATYNQFVHVPCGQNLPNSEALWQQTTAYQHFAVINFNLNPTVQGRGSGIFLHDNTSSGVTAGCIAIAPATLDAVLGWLDPAQNPVIRIGTTSEVSPPTPLGSPPPSTAGNLLSNGSFESSAALSGWRAADGFAARSYNDPNAAHDGQWVANGYTTAPYGSLFQDVAVTASAGQSFVGTLWVRSNEGFAGSLALFGLGGSDANVTYFSAGPGWTQVQVPLDLRSGSISGIRFQLYAYTVGHNITFDGAELTANALSNGSFESSAALSGWRAADGFAARSYNDPNAAHDGQWVANGYTTAPYGSLFQDVAVTASAGQSFVGTLWVRSNEGFAGSLALFGLGGSDANVTYFSAGPGWTQVQVPLDLRSGSISGIRFQLYAYTVGHNITFDGADLTANALSNGSFESSAALSGWRAADGFAVRSYNDPNAAHDGQWVANGYTTAPYGSLFQDVAVTASAGQSFVGTLWVRSNEGFAGSLALFGLGGSDANVTYFSAGPGWTQVQVPLDLRSGSISGIRFQLYAYTVGHNITFDGAELTVKAAGQ